MGKRKERGTLLLKVIYTFVHYSDYIYGQVKAFHVGNAHRTRIILVVGLI